ncbi:MAG TPA: tRNA (guanine-N7)-methyltransferase [Polyangiaceae bacterium]|nr:tRNA (guanine-N7)-methyltransferase [Polyangiaceae bacterium]
MRNPYFDAPRLPNVDQVDPRLLVGAGPEPIELEIGPGRGGFLFERLAAFGQVRMIGLEVRLKWAKIVDDKLRERGFGERARVFAEDAVAAVRRFPDACLAAVFVHFPDPWWKKRHEKRLVVRDALLSELARVMVSGAELFVQTDVEERAAAYAQLIGATDGFVPVETEASVSENPYGARSPREHRAMADGLPIYRFRYRRSGPVVVGVPAAATVPLSATPL